MAALGTNALAVYLLNRYAVRRIAPAIYKGGLPGNRLKRVLDYITAYLDGNMSLVQLAAIAGMSPHYFSELFKRSTGRAPHNYVLMQRIERAKQQLRDPKRSIIDAGLDAGFQNPSHFARMFRKLEGTTPSKYRAGHVPQRDPDGSPLMLMRRGADPWPPKLEQSVCSRGRRAASGAVDFRPTTLPYQRREILDARAPCLEVA